MTARVARFACGCGVAADFAARQIQVLEAAMMLLQVTVRIKPECRAEYLEAVRHDAEHSERDEPGCLRFDVAQDKDDPNRFYYYEVYRDEAALEAHRQTPHFKLYAEKVQAWLAAPPERRFGKNIIPSDPDWR